MEMDKGLIDKLLTDYEKPEDLIGENGLLKQLTKALVERALQAELTTHLGYEKHSAEGQNSGNSRNGASTKRGVISARWRSRCRETGRRVSIRSWCPRGRRALPALTTRSCRCTRGA